MRGIGDSFKQIEKLKSNPLFNSTDTLRVSVAADGKDREMYCLPYGYCLAWMLGINSANVKEEVRDNLIAIQKACAKALELYFFGSLQKQIESNKAEVKMLEELAGINNEIAERKNRVNEINKQLAKLRAERLDSQQVLAFEA